MTRRWKALTTLRLLASVLLAAGLVTGTSAHVFYDTCKFVCFKLCVLLYYFVILLVFG